jgi:hypothetical protein
MTEPPSPLTMLFSRHTRRRGFIPGLAGAAAWPMSVHAQRASNDPGLPRGPADLSLLAGRQVHPAQRRVYHREDPAGGQLSRHSSSRHHES